MRSPRALSAMVAATLLSGCATAPSAPPPAMSPYPAAGYGYGYREERIGPDLLRVVYHGPLRRLDPAAAARGPQLDRAANEAADLALWRAAQLALAEGKPALAVIERRTDTETLRHPAGWTYDPWWPDYCYPRYAAYSSCRSWPPSYVPPATDGRARATLTVRLESRVTPGNVDAAAAIRRLEQIYRPSAPPPAALRP